MSLNSTECDYIILFPPKEQTTSKFYASMMSSNPSFPVSIIINSLIVFITFNLKFIFYILTSCSLEIAAPFRVPMLLASQTLNLISPVILLVFKTFQYLYQNVFIIFSIEPFKTKNLTYYLTTFNYIYTYKSGNCEVCF